MTTTAASERPPQCDASSSRSSDDTQQLADQEDAALLDTLDYLSALPRSVKMSQVCFDNKRHSVRLQRTLDTLQSARHKAWFNMDAAQRDFITVQVFDKQLRPFHCTSSMDGAPAQPTVGPQRRQQQQRQGSREKSGQENTQDTAVHGRPSETSAALTAARHANSHSSRSQGNKHCKNRSREISRTPQQAVAAATGSLCPAEALVQLETDADRQDGSGGGSRGPRSTTVTVDQRHKTTTVGHLQRTAEAAAPGTQQMLLQGQRDAQQTAGPAEHVLPVLVDNKPQSQPRHRDSKKRPTIEQLRRQNTTCRFPTLMSLADQQRAGNPALPTVTSAGSVAGAGGRSTMLCVESAADKERYGELLEVMAASVAEQLQKLSLQRSQQLTAADRQRVYQYRRQLLHRTRRRILPSTTHRPVSITL